MGDATGVGTLLTASLLLHTCFEESSIMTIQRVLRGLTLAAFAGGGC